MRRGPTIQTEMSSNRRNLFCCKFASFGRDGRLFHSPGPGAANASENETKIKKEAIKNPSFFLSFFLSLAHADVEQPLHCGIRCCVEGSETIFELIYRAAVNDVRHGLVASQTTDK